VTEKVLFIIFAALAVAGGIGTVTRRNVVHGSSSWCSRS